MKRLHLAVAVLSLLASACQPGLLAPTATPTSTPNPPPTVTPSPTPTPSAPQPPTRTPWHAPTPLPTRTPWSSPTPTPPAITVTSPRAGDVIRNPVRVTGQAMVFEGTVQLRLKDAYGQVIGWGFVQATGGAPERGDYTVDLFYAAPAATQEGVLEVYETSAKDGSELHMVGVPVRLTADDTPLDWQTYGNGVYGWTVRYPADWYVNQGEFFPPPPATIKLSNYQVVTGTNRVLGLGDASIWIAITDVATALGEMSDLESKGYTRRQVIVGGTPGDRFIAPQPTHGLGDAVYLIQGSQPIRIHLSAQTQDYDRTFEQVLGTFAFGEPAAGDLPQHITVYQADQGRDLSPDDAGFVEIARAFAWLVGGLDTTIRTVYNDDQVAEYFGETNRVLLVYTPVIWVPFGDTNRIEIYHALVVDGGADHGGYQVLIRAVGNPVWHIYMTSRPQLFTDLAAVVEAETGVSLVRN